MKLALLALAVISGLAAQPTINNNQIVNASGYQTKLAPDTVFVIFGAGLGPAAIVTADAPNYPASLGGTSIAFTPAGGGSAIPAKMIYSLATQAAGLLPSSIAPGTYAVRVTYNGQTSAAQNIIVVARSFGIATASSTGVGNAQATIGNVNNGLSLTRFTSGSLAFGGYTWTLTPAHPGDTLVLWGTGGGADLANDTGGTSGDQTKAGNFIVTVGTRQIIPGYAGASSGYPGLWQINFTLPPDITPDCFASLQVTAGGEPSNAVYVPIAAAGQTACSDSNVTPAVLSKMDSGGNIVVATFGTVRLASPSLTQELVSGGVFSYTPAEWTQVYSGPKIGSCTVYDRSYPVGGKDPGAPDSYLDAGKTLAVSGTNVAGATVNAINTSAGPSYYVVFTNGTLATGKYTLTAPGGTQVGPFIAVADFPPNFTVTNWDFITSIDRSKPLTINWTSSGVTTVVFNINADTTASSIHHIVSLNCSIPANLGTYTIPTAALAYLLPVAASGVNFGGIGVVGQGATTNFTANLVKGGQVDMGLFDGQIEVQKNIAIQ